MGDEIFLAAYHGGLGDNLQFSTLPEQFAKQKNKKTYILESAKFRNPEIYDLVWGKNPYVIGKKQGNWNAGDTPDIKYYDILGNTIQNWEKFHNLIPVNKYPKIYYKPNKVNELNNVFLVDFSCISIEYDYYKLKNTLCNLKSIYSNCKFIFVRFKNLINDQHHIYDLGFSDYIEVDNIFKYCDLLCSVYGFIGLSSGASHLTSALKEYSPNLKSICIIPKKWYDIHKQKGIFLFDNIEYIIYD